MLGYAKPSPNLQKYKATTPKSECRMNAVSAKTQQKYSCYRVYEKCDRLIFTVIFKKAFVLKCTKDSTVNH